MFKGQTITALSSPEEPFKEHTRHASYIDIGPGGKHIGQIDVLGTHTKLVGNSDTTYTQGTVNLSLNLPCTDPGKELLQGVWPVFHSIMFSDDRDAQHILQIKDGILAASGEDAMRQLGINLPEKISYHELITPLPDPK